MSWREWVAGLAERHRAAQLDRALRAQPREDRAGQAGTSHGALLLARRLRGESLPVPAPESQQRAWLRLQAALRAQPAQRTAPRPAVASRRWQLAGGLAAVLLAAGLGLGTWRALPGSPLYGPKLSVEQIPLFFARDPEAAAAGRLAYAAERLQDTQAALASGGGPRLAALPLSEARRAIQEAVVWRSQAPQGEAQADPALQGLVRSYGQLAGQAGLDQGLQLAGRVDRAQGENVLLGGLPVTVEEPLDLQPGTWVQADVQAQASGEIVAADVQPVEPPVAALPAQTEAPSSTPSVQPASPTPTRAEVLPPWLPTVPSEALGSTTPTASPTTTPTAAPTLTATSTAPAATATPANPTPTAIVAPPVIPTAPLPTPTPTPVTPTPPPLVGTPFLPTPGVEP